MIDVGYSVIGAERISHGQSPYATPIEGDRPACGPADASGEIRTASRPTGAAGRRPQGDTYGPVSYLAYLPAYWIFG